MYKKKYRPAAFVLCLALSMASACNKAPDVAGSTPEVTLEAESETTVRETTSSLKPGVNYARKDELSSTAEAQTEETTTEPETPSPNIGLTALAMVPNYVNVRSGPTTEDEIVGKIYNYCAAEILDEVAGEGGNWFLMTSGNVKGYIMSDYFLVGEEAEAMRKEVGVLMGTVTEDYLRVRSEPNLEDPDNVFTYYERGTEVYITEMTEDGLWAKIESDDASAGYVYGECMEIRTVFKTAITIEEEEEQLRLKAEREEAARKAEEEYQAALKAQQEAEAAAAAAAQQQQQQAQQGSAANPETANTGNEAADALRNAVVRYALQFVGNPYVHGGRSLVTGTDCSGFTSLVYQHFGYSLSYTPSGQSEQGTRVDLSRIQPGDLLFYSNSQKYLGHVALYIGNGQIVHAGTEATGILVSSAYYRDPLFAVRIIND